MTVGLVYQLHQACTEGRGTRSGHGAHCLGGSSRPWHSRLSCQACMFLLFDARTRHPRQVVDSPAAQATSRCGWHVANRNLEVLTDPLETPSCNIWSLPFPWLSSNLLDRLFLGVKKQTSLQSRDKQHFLAIVQLHN